MDGIKPHLSSSEALRQSTDAKIKRAGTQFEAILLNNVLGDLERAFTTLPGKKANDSAQAYSGFAMQALASVLADKGATGIGGLIERALSKRAGSNPLKTTESHLKDF